MVTRIRKFMAHLLIVVALMPSTLWAATNLTLQLNSTQVEQGSFLQAELRGLNLGRDLSQVDLSPLTPLFGVRIIETTTESDSKSTATTQRMLLRLYPRQTGHLSIPALHLDDLATAVSSVIVNPPFSKNQPITLSIHQSAQQVWQRQQMIIEAELKTAGPFITLQTDDLVQRGSEVLTLPITQQTLQEDKTSYTLFHLQWIIYPQVSGNLSLALPPLKYTTGGLVEREFYLPLIPITIKPLPPYIPPTIPVGKVTHHLRGLNKTLYTTDKTATWEITLQSTELLAQELPAVLRQINSTDSIEFQMATSQRSQKPDAQGPHGQVIHRIPYKPTSTGIFTLPALRIQYFDPDSGRLVTVKSPSQSAYAISPLWMLVLGALGIIIFAMQIRKLTKSLVRYRDIKRIRKTAIKLATTANNPVELHQALKYYGQALGWPENIGLRSWSSYWAKTYPKNTKLEGLIQRLSIACYGRQQTKDYPILQKEIIRVLMQTRVPLLNIEL